jgi:radical SAM protein with 4Fe4S-binding SPASM domain
MSILHPLIDWDGTMYFCAFFHHRKKTHNIGSLRQAKFSECWFSKAHLDRRKEINPEQCVANCPMTRYNAVVKFILAENFRFPYI